MLDRLRANNFTNSLCDSLFPADGVTTDKAVPQLQDIFTVRQQYPKIYKYSHNHQQ